MKRDLFAPIDPALFIRRVFGDFDRFFDERPRRLVAAPEEFAGVTWMPELEVFERDHTLVARLDLPGLKKEEVSITVNDEGLAITGERKVETEGKKGNWYTTERTYGKFLRIIPLPEGVKAGDVKATFENGVLEVTVPLPVAAAPAAPYKVPIGAAAEKKA